MKCETLMRNLAKATGKVYIFTDHDRVLNLYFDDDELNYTIREGYCGDSSIIHITELYKSGNMNKYLIDSEKVSYVLVSNVMDEGD